MVAQKGYLSTGLVEPKFERGITMKMRILVALLAIVLVFAFTGSVLAFGFSSGSWKSSVCMYGFTAKAPLIKDEDHWDHFTPKPEYVKYANGENYGWMDAFVKTPGGTRMSGTCNCWALEDDNVAIYSSADAYDTLRVRIENSEYPGEYNMESKGTFEADYYND